jgi:hypothetical protein
MNSNFLNIIYDQRKLKLNDGETGLFYKIVYCFTKEGLLRSEILVSIQNKINTPETDTPLAFRTLEEVQLFAMDALKEIGCAEANLISTQEFNIALETVFHRDEMINFISKLGQKIVLPSDQITKKSFFSRFFK